MQSLSWECLDASPVLERTFPLESYCSGGSKRFRVSFLFLFLKTGYELFGFISHMGTSTMSGHYICHLRKEGRWVQLGETHGMSKEMFDLKHLCRAGRAHGRQHGLLPSPTKKKTIVTDVMSVLIPLKPVVKCAIGSPVPPFKSLFNLGCCFWIWLSLSGLSPTSFCCPSIGTINGTVGWYWCCWYCGADLGWDFDVLPLFDVWNPCFSFIWAGTTHASAHSSFSIPDSASWFGHFSDPLFSLQCQNLVFKLFEAWVWEVPDKPVVIFIPMECNQCCFPFRWVIYNDLRVCASERPPKDLGYIYFYHRIPS